MDIFNAIKTGDIKAVASYIKSGGDLNVRNFYQMTPLIVAAEERQAELVKLLIPKSDINAKDKIGQTALILATGRNDAAIVKLLIDAKADLNVKYISGLTAYQTAVENGLNEVAQLLKKAGAK